MPQDDSPEDALTDYPHRARFPTRWNDNDIYGHVNHTVHYMAMDTVINAWMIEHAGLVIGPDGDAPVGLCVESGCRYLASVEYPDTIEVGLRVAVHTETKEEAEKVRRACSQLWIMGPGGTSFGTPIKPRPVYALWPTLIPRDFVKQTVEILEV